VSDFSIHPDHPTGAVFAFAADDPVTALPVLTAVLRGTLLAPPDEVTRRRHLAAMVAAHAETRPTALAHHEPVRPTLARRGRRRPLVAAGVAGAVLLGSAGLAAAGQLPAPVQSRLAAAARIVGLTLPVPVPDRPPTDPSGPSGPAAAVPAAPQILTGEPVAPAPTAPPAAEVPIPTAPGHDGSAPGQSGNTPGQSGNTPGQSGSAPGQSGSAPVQSGNTPGQSGNTPAPSGNPSITAPGRVDDGPAALPGGAIGSGKDAASGNGKKG
jgi:hypothetical protein